MLKDILSFFVIWNALGQPQLEPPLSLCHLTTIACHRQLRPMATHFQGVLGELYSEEVFSLIPPGGTLELDSLPLKLFSEDPAGLQLVAVACGPCLSDAGCTVFKAQI